MKERSSEGTGRGGEWVGGEGEGEGEREGEGGGGGRTKPSSSIFPPSPSSSSSLSFLLSLPPSPPLSLSILLRGLPYGDLLCSSTCRISIALTIRFTSCRESNKVNRALLYSRKRKRRKRRSYNIAIVTGRWLVSPHLLTLYPIHHT